MIAELIESLRAQDYPADKLDIFVVADNCTDATAAVARQAGAQVFERFDTARVGKGYALDFLFCRLREAGLEQDYAGYFVFDADNLVDANFVAEAAAISPPSPATATPKTTAPTGSAPAIPCGFCGRRGS